MSRPSFQFYPDDWQADVALRRCSPGARGVWIDLICLMHQGEPYGYLASKTGAFPIKFLAQSCGISIGKLAGFMQELEVNGVLSRDENGQIFSRRMVRDERVRVARATGGPKSKNNPNVPRTKVKDIHQGYPLRTAPVGPAYAEDGDEEGSSSGVVASLGARENRASQRFPEWWAAWSAVRGTNHRIQAETVYVREVTIYTEKDCFECMQSYLASLDNPAKGYNPENFLVDQAPDKFTARFKARSPPSRQGSLAERTIALMAKRIEKGDRPF